MSRRRFWGLEAVSWRCTLGGVVWFPAFVSDAGDTDGDSDGVATDGVQSAGNGGNSNGSDSVYIRFRRGGLVVSEVRVKRPRF